METKTVMSDYQRFIAMSRYARFLPEKKRRETWEETVMRYCDFWEERYPGVFPKDRAYSAIVNMQNMPSMRALMTAGKALARDEVAGYNCFSRETQFVTDEGIKSFNDFEDGDPVTVLSQNSFVGATVRKFGVAPLKKLTVKKGKEIREYYTTDNHRWITLNKQNLRNEKTTGELKPGDALVKAKQKLSVSSPMTVCNVGIMHGMVYGDGTSQYGSTKIMLCGDSVQFKDLFTTGKHNHKSDTRHSVSQLPWNWKQLPPITANKNYLMGFMMGWFGADGSVGKSGSNISLCCKDRDALNWARGAFAKLGIFTSAIGGGIRQNPFDPSKECYIYGLTVYRDSIPDYFFLKDTHSARFQLQKIKDKYQWKVISVEETNRVEDVWCVQVPERESFVLDCGIETKNCSYIAIDDPRCFDEALYVLACGTGLGFSVERQVIAKLPTVSEDMRISDTVIKVRDSKIGWASAFKELIAMLYSGQVPTWDLSALRAAGMPLKTFGGRSSGPAPLNDLFKFTVSIFRNAAGRKLTSVECHDLMCHVGACIVVGGVRRSACISLSNLSDDRMRNAKTGQWWVDHGQRALANNSVAYTEKPEMGAFMEEWASLYNSKSGERGIFNRAAAVKKMKSGGRRDWKKYQDQHGGINPCAEIFLRNNGLCNLTTSVVRPEDTLEDLLAKVETASILGTFQATLTNFRYLRSIWKKNAEEERLLGVSLVGIMDHPVLSGRQGLEKAAEWFDAMREHAVKINIVWAEKLGINPAVAVTCTKPEGTVSQLVDASSGIHARFAKHYVRTVRNDKLDPLGIFLKEQGICCEDDVMKPDKTYVFSFPQKSPEGAVTADEINAIDQLEHYLVAYKHWAEHTVSITVYVKEHEWMEVGAWVYKHFDDVGGISFLPYSGHSYAQAPYQPVTEAVYNEWVAKTPKVDWSQYDVNEYEDKTVGAQQLACSGSSGCELI